jgi:hypothetical protein
MSSNIKSDKTPISALTDAPPLLPNVKMANHAQNAGGYFSSNLGSKPIAQNIAKLKPEMHYTQQVSKNNPQIVIEQRNRAIAELTMNNNKLLNQLKLAD